MMEVNEEQATRLAQVDTSNIEYRLQKLEDERLPRRVTEVEFGLQALQGEVTAVKEIARSIGVKVDAGNKELASSFTLELSKIQTKQTEALSFMRGIMWFGGALITLLGIIVTISPAIRKLLGD